MAFKSHSDLTTGVWDSLLSSFLEPHHDSPVQSAVDRSNSTVLAAADMCTAQSAAGKPHHDFPVLGAAGRCKPTVKHAAGKSKSTVKGAAGKSKSTEHSSPVIEAHKGVVATDDWRCSKIGKEVLLHGGNAVDAAVAAALCLGVVSSASSGIGGGAFMLIRLANGMTTAFDMREAAPMFAEKNMYKGNAALKARGHLSIAVPGELAGLHKAWEKHGSLKWDMLVYPASVMADKFKISHYLYSEMVSEQSGIFADKGLSEIFTLNGRLLQPNDFCHNKKLAETLKTIAKGGAKAFYDGSIGEKLIRDIEQIKGLMTILDLNSYEVQMREPLSADILGMTLLGMPPPSAGGAGIILMLNILAQYGIPLDISSPLGIHRMIEALKHVFAVRMNIGDPKYSYNVSEVVDDMLSIEFAKELKETIDDNKTFNPSHYGGRWNEIRDYQKHEYGTSHLSIIDVHGNAVAMTSSVNYHFGAQILSPSTGILLNNQMDDFSMPKLGNDSNDQQSENNNYIHGGKRPLSSMSPTIILKNGKLEALIGGSGGTLIIPGVSQVILNLFVRKLDEKKSLMAPRVYHQLIPNVVHYENFTSVTGDRFEAAADILKALERKGHVLKSLNSGAVCQFITLNTVNSNKKIMAASDPRKGGAPEGY